MSMAFHGFGYSEGIGLQREGWGSKCKSVGGSGIRRTATKVITNQMEDETDYALGWGRSRPRRSLSSFLHLRFVSAIISVCSLSTVSYIHDK